MLITRYYRSIKQIKLYILFVLLMVLYGFWILVQFESLNEMSVEGTFYSRKIFVQRKILASLTLCESIIRK